MTKIEELMTLLSSQKNKGLTGYELAYLLGVRASTMRKLIAKLRMSGNIIIANSKLGYKLVVSPDLEQAKECFNFLEQRLNETKIEAIRINTQKKALYQKFSKEQLQNEAK